MINTSRITPRRKSEIITSKSIIDDMISACASVIINDVKENWQFQRKEEYRKTDEYFKKSRAFKNKK